MYFQHQISSAISVAAIQNSTVTISDFVKKTFKMVRPDDREELKALEELYTFVVNNGELPLVVDLKS